MKTSLCCKVACGLLVAVAGMNWSRPAAAQPYLHHHHHHPYVVRPILPPYPVVTRVVVPPAPVYNVVYREVAPPANPAPSPICVTVVNPEDTGATLSFRVNGTRYSLSAGAERELHFSGRRVLEFDRGEGFGTARVLLQEGTYRFISTDRGWALRRDT